jgi:tetratricopeptide (TPR) repeat protein
MSSIYTPPEADQEIAPPSGFELLWLNHRGSLLGGLAGVIVLAAIVLGVLASERANTLASETLLANASNEAALNEVIAKYPKSPAAADAMLLVAASLRENGKLAESDALYSRFTESFPKNSLAVSGLLGRASNARVAGKPQEALSDYQQASSGFPQSYGAPFALLDSARLLAQNGKMEEAKKTIQLLVTQYPYSLSAQTTGASRGGGQN